MEADNQTEEEQVNIIEPSDPINYSNGHWTFCSWHWFYGLWCWNWKPWKTDRTDLLQLKIAKQFCTTDLYDFDYEEDDFEDFFE